MRFVTLRDILIKRRVYSMVVHIFMRNTFVLNPKNISEAVPYQQLTTRPMTQFGNQI